MFVDVAHNGNGPAGGEGQGKAIESRKINGIFLFAPVEPMTERVMTTYVTTALRCFLLQIVVASDVVFQVIIQKSV